MILYSATGVTYGTKITAISTDTITLSAPLTATLTTQSVTIYSPYSIAYDTFKAATNGTRPSGYLIVRTNVPVSTAIAAADEVNVFKFMADAVMDNTAGEDSIKFMVNFVPQGLVTTGTVIQA